MTRPRLIVLAFFTVVALMALARVLLEIGVALVGGEVHTSLLDTPVVWVLCALFATWSLAVSLVLTPPRNHSPRSRR